MALLVAEELLRVIIRIGGDYAIYGCHELVLMDDKGQIPVIDVFAGMGCASLGLRNAGFRIAGALEIDPIRCELYEKNLGVKPVQCDVIEISGRVLLRSSQIRKGERFVMVGCPPCQSFSSLADTKGVDTLNDPRSKYVQKFAELVKEMVPACVVFENVRGMISGPGKRFFKRYLSDMEKAGYKTRYGVLNTADYGVPQNRRRIVSISVKKKFLRNGALGEIEKFLVQKNEKRTVRDAFMDLMPLERGKQDPNDAHHSARNHGEKVSNMIEHVSKDGGSRRSMPRDLWLECHKKIKSGAETVYGRMWWDEPSPTMTCRCTTPACGRFIHPEEHRGITIREAARLQTIPDSFQLSGSRQKNEAMIGDAVPVHLARRIGDLLMAVLN